MYQFEGTSSNSKARVSQDKKNARKFLYVDLMNTEIFAQQSNYPTIDKKCVCQ